MPHPSSLLCLWAESCRCQHFQTSWGGSAELGGCRASSQELLIAAIDHLSSFDLLAADYSCCSWWWSTRGPACTSISLSSFQVFTGTKHFSPKFQNRWDSAANTAVRKANTIKLKCKIALWEENIRSLNPASSKVLEVDIRHNKPPENTSPFWNFPCTL